MGLVTDFFGKIGKGIVSFFLDIPEVNLLVLGFKIVALLFIVGWVRSHLGGGLVSTVVMLVVSYMLLFEYFIIFGPLALLYFVMIVGLGGTIADFFFGRYEYIDGPMQMKEQQKMRGQGAPMILR
jgi:hypothetical protein